VLEYDVQEKIVTTHRAQGTTVELGCVFDVLDRELAERPIAPTTDLPAGLLGGFVGYLGYECKADCGSANIHRSDVPDAVLMLANRVIAVDHAQQRTLLAALCNEDDLDAERWLSFHGEVMGQRVPALFEADRQTAWCMAG
jgi:para-aminobenzoate synthetase